MRSFTSTIGPVHITAEKFEHAALFLRLGLPFTLIRMEDGAFPTRSSNRRNLKTPALRRIIQQANLAISPTSDTDGLKIGKSFQSERFRLVSLEHKHKHKHKRQA